MNKNKRLIALDAFRGFTMAAMIIVNTPGGPHHEAYAPLQHATWNGITPTDFIFPFFIFIVGVAIVLSFRKQRVKKTPKRQIVQKLLKRSAILFSLGLLLNLFPELNFSEFRIPGVLQRIALVYLACSLLFLYTDRKTQVWTGVAILVVYWLLMTVVPVPGYGYSIMEPGKNLAAWLDNLLIPGVMWQGTWDPEGILSTFPAIVTGITGMLTGYLLLSDKSREYKIIWLFSIGFLAFAAGNVWSWFFPINKNLWTSSYVLYTSGLAAMVLAVSYFFIDVLKYSSWTKIGVVFGSNAITAYVIAGILPALLILPLGNGESINSIFMDKLINIGLAPKFVSLLWALGFCMLCYIPIYILYKKKIFIKV